MESPPTSLPRHIAIIMDGNGRWAQGRRLSRTMGHEEGARVVRAITTECARLGIERLTLYAFSYENWKRPRREIHLLMRLLKRFLVGERPTLAENDVRLTAIGRLDDLPAPVRKELDATVQMSSAHTGMNLCLALSYGGRTEIVDAARRLAARVQAGEIRPEDIDEASFSASLYQPGPHPDLLIRTAGEMRLSNFLLWQISYTELYVTEVCWPEFAVKDLHEALQVYARRTRKYGGLLEAPEPRMGS